MKTFLKNESIKTYKKIYDKYLKSKMNKVEFVETLETRNQISKFKNSLKHFDKLNNVESKEIKKIYYSRPKRKAITKDQFKVKSFWMSINNSRNKKHKLPFRLSILSGLRISELSNLRKEDITLLEDGRIKINVINGKGGKSRTVTTIMQDKYLYDNIKELLENKKDSDKAFYSKNYLHEIAKKHNFTNHDLRKTCIQKIYYSCNYDNDKTIRLIQAYLGHIEASKTYMYYLSRDINATGTKFDI